MSSRLDIRSASLLDILPDSIASEPEIVAMSLALDPELQDIATSIVKASILPRIAGPVELPEDVLDALAWGFGLSTLSTWDHATRAGKQSMLQGILDKRRRAGTPSSLSRVFDLLLVTAQIIEWWEEGAAPHTYRVRIEAGDVGITEGQILQIPALLHRFERASQQLSELGVEVDSSGALYLYPALTVGTHTTITYGAP